uniref:Uncharacterized protein n=1 Tax=Romanomermis culicivorax TaxID=13658 RepID=A0A915L260_ROMCU
MARERVLRAMRRTEPRAISAIRVNPRQMSVSQLNVALRRKMVEKLKRKVPVTLIDR